jgi:hypothetical protein
MLFAFLALLAAVTAANAHQPMARCVDMARGGIPYIIMNNGYSYQENLPMNAGWAARDPSGQTFMRLPAQNPMTNAFFMGWQGQLIELNVWAPRPTVIGQCTSMTCGRARARTMTFARRSRKSALADCSEPLLGARRRPARRFIGEPARRVPSASAVPHWQVSTLFRGANL